MDRRVALIALWVVFAGASVGVGFGAAGLVGDPFTHTAASLDAASGPLGGSMGSGRPSDSAGYASGSPTGVPAGTSSALATTRPKPHHSAATSSTGPGHSSANGATSRPGGPSGGSGTPGSGGGTGHGTPTSAGSGGSSHPTTGSTGDDGNHGTPSSRPSTSPPPTPTPTIDASRSLTTRGGFVAGTCSGTSVSLSASPAVGWQIDEIRGGPATEASVTFHQSSGGEGEVQVEATCSGGSPRFAVQDRSGTGDTAPWGPSDPSPSSD